jgi:hypothetical protein
MVYYIRFLKTPRLQKQKTGTLSASALICITTDLGDAFLAQDEDLLGTLRLAGNGKAVCQWQGGKRELPVALGPLPASIVQQSLIMEIASRASQAVGTDSLLNQDDIPLVVSGWSAPFGGSQSVAADKLIERRFSVNQTVQLNIWEETGNSIARHIW